MAHDLEAVGLAGGLFEEVVAAIDGVVSVFRCGQVEVVLGPEELRTAGAVANAVIVAAIVAGLVAPILKKMPSKSWVVMSSSMISSA